MSAVSDFCTTGDATTTGASASSATFASGCAGAFIDALVACFLFATTPCATPAGVQPSAASPPDVAVSATPALFAWGFAERLDDGRDTDSLRALRGDRSTGASPVRSASRLGATRAPDVDGADSSDKSLTIDANDCRPADAAGLPLLPDETGV
ncbi:MAG: hypothetical protein U0Q11_01845 [Vicinamibacterales bacterium]